MIFDPISPEFFNDPHRFFPEMLAAEVVHHEGTLYNTYSVFDFETVKASIRDWETFTNLPPEGYVDFMGAADFVGVLDPPEQTRLRRLLSKAMPPSWVKQQTEFMEQTAAEVVAEALTKDEVNFYEDVGSAFVTKVLLGMLGLDLADSDLYWSIADDLVGAFGWGSYLSEDDPRMESIAVAARNAMDTFMAHIEPIIDHHLAHPSDALASRLLNAEDGDERLTREEATIMVRDLAVGALDTTSLGSTALALRLAENPEQDALLRENPDLVMGAVDEALRYDPPGMQIFRRARHDVEVLGRSIPEGSEVHFWIFPAAFSEEVNPDPYAFQIERERRVSLPFSAGPHTCPGAFLSRMEMGILWKQILASTSALEVDTDSVGWMQGAHLHGPTTLTTRLVAAR